MLKLRGNIIECCHRLLKNYHKFESESLGFFRRGYHSKYFGCASSSRSLKVAVLNANQQTGRILSLCLKQSPIIDELAVYDPVSIAAASLARDLSLVTTRCRTFDRWDPDDATNKKKCNDEDALKRALYNAKVVVFVSDRGKCVEQDARNLQLYIPYILAICPKAFVALVTNSTNSLVPMTYELYRKVGAIAEGHGSRIFGVTSLFATRANTHAGQLLGIKPEFVSVPVVGGADPYTVVPLFSHTQPSAEFSLEEIVKLQESMRQAEDVVCSAYRGSILDWELHSSAICTGYSAARFCNSLCKALRSETGVIECAYTRSNVLGNEVSYFGAPLELGSCGIQRHLDISRLADAEYRAVSEVLPHIKSAIKMGECLADREAWTCPDQKPLDPNPKKKKKEEEEK